MASLSEMIQLCRLCLVKDHVNIPIFDDPENVRQIPLKISSCLPVKISIDDNLPKKICDGCSNKLDLCYEFWNSTAHAEKTLLAMVEEKENQVPEAEMPQPFLLKVEAVESLEESQNQICEPPVPKPILVKDEEEAEDPPAKRPRRSAAIQAQMQIIPESDDEDDAAEGLATTKEVAEMDDDFEDPDVPDMIVDIDEVKPGPSGLNQTGVNSQFANAKARQLRVILVRHEFNLTENGVRIVFPITSKANKDDITSTSKELIKKDGSGATAKKKETLTIKTEPGLVVEDSKLEQHESSNITKPPYVYANFKVVVKLYCQKCGELFDDFGELHRHIFQNTDKSHKFNCAQCKLAVGETMIHQRMHFENFCKPREHTCAEQKFPSNYFCEICGKVFKTLAELENHQRIHSGVKLRCPLCPWSQNSFTRMMCHYRSHVLNGNIELKCARCPLVFYSTRTYQVHCLAVHSQSIFIPYECILCPTVIVDDVQKFLFHVQAHCCIKPVADSKRPKFNDDYLTCEVCSQIFQDKKGRKEHEMVHPSVLLENRRCGICSNFFSVKAMWGHMQSHQKKRFNRMVYGKAKAFEMEIKRKQMYDPKPKEGFCLTKVTALPSSSQSCPPLSSDPELEVKKKQMYDPKPKEGFSLTNSSQLPLNTSTFLSSVTVSSYPEPTSSQRSEPTRQFLEWSSVEGDPSVAPSVVMETNAKPLEGSYFPQPDLQYLDPSDLPSFF